MAAAKGPPVPSDSEFPFRHVMEYPGRLDPRISRVFPAYAEPIRRTRDVELGGRRRPLVFLTRDDSQARAHRLFWKDRTEQFKREYHLVGEGSAARWVPRDPLAPEPIREPDARTIRPAPDADLLGLSVKDLQRALATGKHDAQLDDLLTRERARYGGERVGAVAALSARAQVVRQAAAGGA